MNPTEWLAPAVAAFSGLVFAEVPIFGVPAQLIVLWVAAAMVFTTVWLGVPQVRGFSEAWRVLRGRYFDPEAPGEISQFSALTTALSSTLGLGNIAGVAVAITTGGPGAIFWMMLIGIFSMALKCAEVTLGLMYREILPDGRVNGGPFVTLPRGLAAIGRPKTGRVLGTVYAILALGGCLAFFQVNQAFAQVGAVTGLENAWVFGTIFAVLIALVLLGSVRWIARATSVLVPFMCIVYVGGCLAILAVNWTQIPAAVGLILGEAFRAESVWGGALGAFVVGMRRAVYSTEAGIGTAVIAHTQAKTRDPASEGLVALVEPFLDTVLMCTLSGLAFVVAGTWNAGAEGIGIASDAFAQIASWFPAVLALAVFLFAYATVLANGFYGAQAFAHLAGHGRRRSLAYRTLFCLLLPLGAVLDLKLIVDFADSFFFLMAIPNIIGIYFLARPLRQEIERYLALRRDRPIDAPPPVVRAPDI
jgi:AGCS family alanine or glycine:cation symporter